MILTKNSRWDKSVFNYLSWLILSSLLFIIPLFTGCGTPECTAIIYDANSGELSRALRDYSLPEDSIPDIIARDSFNKKIRNESHGVSFHFHGDKVSCDSVRLISDSLICSCEDEIRIFAIRDIGMLKVYYENRNLSLLKNSAIIGVFTSAFGLLGYLPPNPPQPDWKSFAGLFGAGFILGIIFDVSSSSYYCFASKESIITIIKERQKNIKQNAD